MFAHRADPWTQRVATYLDRTLGVGLLRWYECPEQRLPVYLEATFDIACTELLGTACAFAFLRTPTAPSPTAVAKQLAQLETLLKRPVVLVEPAIPSWRRRRLIDRRIAFVAPGTQLYLPPLGIDLRDAVRGDTHRDGFDEGGSFVPATQVVLLSLLLEAQRRADEAQAIADRVGYSAMSLSRAARTLERAGLISRAKTGRPRRMALQGTPKDVWARAQPRLASPVRARHAAPGGAFRDALDAGETALAQRSMLASPPNRAVAVSGSAWAKHEARHPGQSHEDGEEPGTVTVEVWTYPPESLSSGPTVDPLSLFLSLREEQDARVEAARETLLEVLG